MLQTNIIKSLDLIGKSLHVSRLPEAKQKYQLQQRDTLLAGVLQFLEEKNVPPPSNQLRMLGLNAAATLWYIAATCPIVHYHSRALIIACRLWLQQ